MHTSTRAHERKREHACAHSSTRRTHGYTHTPTHAHGSARGPGPAARAPLLGPLPLLGLLLPPLLLLPLLLQLLQLLPLQLPLLNGGVAQVFGRVEGHLHEETALSGRPAPATRAQGQSPSPRPPPDTALPSARGPNTATTGPVPPLTGDGPRPRRPGPSTALVSLSPQRIASHGHVAEGSATLVCNGTGRHQCRPGRGQHPCGPPPGPRTPHGHRHVFLKTQVSRSQCGSRRPVCPAPPTESPVPAGLCGQGGAPGRSRRSP